MGKWVYLWNSQSCSNTGMAIKLTVWDGLPDARRLDCGVCINASMLFNLYMNELIGELSGRRFEFWIDSICLSNLSYADNMVQLGPMDGSIGGLLFVNDMWVDMG